MDILYEDDALLVIDKPAGIPVLPDGWEPEAPYLVKLLEAGHGKLWIVHRLDKITSGVMLFARTAESHRALSIAFQKHETRKTYHAIVLGTPRWDEHTARHPLRMDAGHSHRTVVDDRRGKPSETQFRALARQGEHALLEANPLTGRTHQIRAHAAALGHAILADILYGAPPSELIARPALHAQSISFDHPSSGLPLAFSAPYPADFALARARLGL